MATLETPTSISKASIPQHSLVPFSTIMGEEIQSIFSTQVVDSIDWDTFVNKTLILPKQQVYY